MRGVRCAQLSLVGPALPGEPGLGLSPADLPLYYRAHRFSLSSRLADYQYLLRSSKRVIFDTAIVPGDALTHPWPRPEAVRDLAYKTPGSFRFASRSVSFSPAFPARLVEGLRVNVTYQVGRHRRHMPSDDG
ncbi:MAG: hypothetical protein U1F61_20140 [Opitutaceae bacterium]